MGQLSTELRPKLARLVPLLGSNQPGEVAATVAAIERTLASAKCDWHDLAAALTTAPTREPSRCHAPSGPIRWSRRDARPIRDVLRFAIDNDLLTRWEIDFAVSILGTISEPYPSPTDKQIGIIERLLRKCQLSTTGDRQ